jgi:hypothetical protein
MFIRSKDERWTFNEKINLKNRKRETEDRSQNPRIFDWGFWNQKTEFRRQNQHISDFGFGIED